MPGFDKTGPMGYRPGSGRRRGRCFGADAETSFGRGLFGFGRQAGRRFCRRSARGFRRCLSLAGDQEKEMLLQEKSWLEKRLSDVGERLNLLSQ